MEPRSDDDAGLLAICLCAQWCGVCRDWRDEFEAQAARAGVRFAWVDVEDEAEAMGDIDIETFPTLLIARAGQARFFGPVQPSGPQLARLLTSLQASASSASLQAPAQALLERLLTGALSKS